MKKEKTANRSKLNYPIQQKHFFFLLVSSLFLLTLSVCLFNYQLDAYGIFSTDYDRQILEPNKNYVKTKMVLEHPEKYDSFLFGSSRVGHIETDKLTDRKFYNMAYSEGLPADWLGTLHTLIDGGVEIRTVLIGLDDFSFTLDPKEHDTHLLRIPYHKLDTVSKFKFYVMRNPLDLYNVNTIKGLLNGQTPFAQYDDFLTTGVSYGNDDVIEFLGAAHTNDPKFMEPMDLYKVNRTEETLAEIQQIIDLCEENGIELHIFFNPIHQTTYNLHKDVTIAARIMLKDMTDYWDFSGYNSITTNNYYWYETSHYRHNVGLMILEKIFDVDLGEPVPYDFGNFREKTAR